MGRKRSKNTKTASSTSAAARQHDGAPSGSPDVTTADETRPTSSHQAANTPFPPSSISARRLQAEFLYTNACFTGEWAVYADVILLCEEALKIPDPVDPIKEPNMSDEKLLKLNTPESRIEHTLQCISYLGSNASYCAKNPVSMKSLPLPSSSSTATPLSKRQRKVSLQQSKAIAQLKRQVQSYLESLSIVDRKAILSVEIPDMREQLGELDPISSEALTIAETGQIPFRWRCCFCEEKFTEHKTHKTHVLKVHVGLSKQDIKDLLPQMPDKDWIQRSSISGWSPLNDQQTSSSTDTLQERAKLLDLIQRFFYLLLNRGILTASHVEKMVQLAMTSKPSAAMLGADKSNECIRQSSTTQLIKILRFLEDLYEIDDDNRKDSSADCIVQEKQWTRLILDSTQEALLWDVLNCGDSGSRNDIVGEDVESLVDWLYSSSTDEEQIHRVAWNRMLLECRNNLKKLQVEFSFFSRLCEEKLMYSLAYNHLTKLGSQDLEKCREELLAKDEKTAIAEILQSAEAENISAKSWVHQKLDMLHWKALELDVRILQTWKIMRPLLKNIGPSSGYDYQIDLMYSVKSFLKKRLKDQMDRDAREMSEAVRKELLEEENKEGDQTKTNKGDDNPKPGKKKTKDKGKKKDTKIANDMKDSGSKEQLLDHEITEMENCAQPAAYDPLDERSPPSGVVDDNVSKSCNDTSVVLESSGLDRTCAEPAACDPLDESSPPAVVDNNVPKSCNDTSVVLESSGSVTTCAEPDVYNPLDESNLSSGLAEDNISKSSKDALVVSENSGTDRTCAEPDACLPPDESCLPLGMVEDHVSKSCKDSSVVSENSSLDISCEQPDASNLHDESCLPSCIVDDNVSKSFYLDRTCADSAYESILPFGLAEDNFSKTCKDDPVILGNSGQDISCVKPNVSNMPDEFGLPSVIVDNVNNASESCKKSPVLLGTADMDRTYAEPDASNPPDESYIPSGVVDKNIYMNCMDLSVVLKGAGQSKPNWFSRHDVWAYLNKKWNEAIECDHVELTLSSEAEISDSPYDCEGYLVETQSESSDYSGQTSIESNKAVEDDHVETQLESYDYCGQSNTGKQLHSIMRRTNSQGTILQNELGENKCLLNVIIQTLYHLDRFKEEFLNPPKHQHISKQPCFICELHDIFTVFNEILDKEPPKTADFVLSWIALRKTDPNRSLFQLGQMNDASKVLTEIFSRIHGSFECFGDCEAKVIDKNCVVIWESGNHTCIAHRLFGMSIYEKSVCESGHQSQGSKYIQLFHHIDATLLRELKVTYAKSSLDDLLTKMKPLCDHAYYGCRTLHHKMKFISSPPHFYLIVLNWQSTCDTSNDILATLDAITLQIDLGLQYCGIYQGGKRILVSVIAFDGQYYISCVYDSEQDKWIKYDGETVEGVGDWNEVCSLLGRLRSRPQILIFEEPKW